MFWLIDTIIVRPIVNILFIIYNLVGDFGLAIIIFTVLVKFLMWPLVKRQLHQTKLMRQIQPELAEIKKRCNGNRQMESLQMMSLYKKYNIKPFRTVITTLIQLPIFLALFMSISAMVNPRPDANTCGYTNVSNCAYAPVRSLSRIDDIVEKQNRYFEAKETAEEGEVVAYEFQPKLFGLIDLSVSPSNVFRGELNISTIVVLLFAIGSALMQYLIPRMNMPSNKNKKSKSFRQLVKEAAAGDGSEPDQSEINELASRQMSVMMPLMMFFIMFYLPGALVFYYLMSNIITFVQQRVVLGRVDDEMEQSADKEILKELKRAKEAKVVENKKTGTKVTRISARDVKKDNKKRRK